MRSEAKKKADKKYLAKTYKPIMSKAKIQDVVCYNDYATRYGISMSKLITSCINYCINNNIDITGGIKLDQSGVQREEINGTATDDSENLD